MFRLIDSHHTTWQALGRGLRWGPHVPSAAGVGGASADRPVGGLVGGGERQVARLGRASCEFVVVVVAPSASSRSFVESYWSGVVGVFFADHAYGMYCFRRMC